MFGKKLKELRKKSGVTQTELADVLGITQQAVGKWESGRSEPDSDTLRRLAEYFETSIDSLLGRPAPAFGTVSAYDPAAEIQIPVVGSVRAGYGALAYQDAAGTAPANVRDPQNYFYLQVKGDSMEPRIQDGDLALVRKQPTLEDGDLGVVVFGDEGEGTLKRFLRKGSAVVLQPFNPAYEPIILAGEDLEHLYIAGRVVETKTRW